MPEMEATTQKARATVAGLLVMAVVVAVVMMAGRMAAELKEQLLGHTWSDLPSTKAEKSETKQPAQPRRHLMPTHEASPLEDWPGRTG